MKRKKNIYDFGEINDILDKMIELEKSKNSVNVYKVIMLITACVAMVIIVVALCIIFYKNSFSFESLLSLLLAFFSIFISIFFYFKADETSNRFYETSYNFMKDVSVTLGKIEERFGEKLNTLNEKVSHLTVAREEKKEELQSVEDEKQKVIDELMEKAKLDASEKEEFVGRLKEKEIEADLLRQQLQTIDMKYRNAIRHQNAVYFKGDWDEPIFKVFSPIEQQIIANKHITDWSFNLRRKMINLGFLNPDGEFTAKGNRLLEELHQKRAE